MLSYLAGISQTSGRIAQTRNFVLSPDSSEETWRALDEQARDAVLRMEQQFAAVAHMHASEHLACAQVNTYPGYRSFKAIGVGGGAFVQAMVNAVESVIGEPVHEECVQERPSSKGSYISVTVGPVLMHNRDQVGMHQYSLASFMTGSIHWSTVQGLTLSCELHVQVVRIYAAMKEDERLKWYM
jgi:putative lipoic acid-binding regulatory protein